MPTEHSETTTRISVYARGLDGSSFVAAQNENGKTNEELNHAPFGAVVLSTAPPTIVTRSTCMGGFLRRQCGDGIPLQLATGERSGPQ